MNKAMPQRDDEGYLVNPEDWTPELARSLAQEESLQLEDQHWLVIDFIRDQFDQHQVTPDIRHAAKFLAGQAGLDKKHGKARIFELFPYGYVKQACKIAGMRRPRAWSTG
jgi:tRNA 2-thiouridine synthesizing protein E